VYSVTQRASRLGIRLPGARAIRMAGDSAYGGAGAGYQRCPPGRFPHSSSKARWIRGAFEPTHLAVWNQLPRRSGLSQTGLPSQRDSGRPTEGAQRATNIGSPRCARGLVDASVGRAPRPSRDVRGRRPEHARGGRRAQDPSANCVLAPQGGDIHSARPCAGHKRRTQS